MRTHARNRFERCVQVLRWAIEEFEVEEGTLRLEWVSMLSPCKRTGREQLYGETTEGRGKIIIRLSARSCATRSQAVETLLHEFAHALMWSTGRGLLHGPEFWQVFGRISDAYDHHGHEDSKSYFVD